jgi:hypothetical protein
MDKRDPTKPAPMIVTSFFIFILFLVTCGPVHLFYCPFSEIGDVVKRRAIQQ